MSMIKINNENYEVPEFTFAHSKRLEQYGVSLRKLVDQDSMLTIASAFVAIVADVGPNEADYLVEQHVFGGGKLEPLFEAYVEAISESHFFKKLLDVEEEKNTETKKKKAQ